MFICDIYVICELTHILTSYEIERFLKFQGVQDVRDIKRIMKWYLFSYDLIMDSNVSMTCKGVWVLIPIFQWIVGECEFWQEPQLAQNGSFDDKTPRIVIDYAT